MAQACGCDSCVTGTRNSQAAGAYGLHYGLVPGVRDVR